MNDRNDDQFPMAVARRQTLTGRLVEIGQLWKQAGHFARLEVRLNKISTASVIVRLPSEDRVRELAGRLYRDVTLMMDLKYSVDLNTGVEASDAPVAAEATP
jgi:hypothetical protein